MPPPIPPRYFDPTADPTADPTGVSTAPALAAKVTAAARKTTAALERHRVSVLSEGGLRHTPRTPATARRRVGSGTRQGRPPPPPFAHNGAAHNGVTTEPKELKPSPLNVITVRPEAGAPNGQTL